jgi:hypothetical protein
MNGILAKILIRRTKMIDKTSYVAISAYVPKEVKKRFNDYCDAKGLRVLFITDKIVEHAMRQIVDNDLTLEICKEVDDE